MSSTEIIQTILHQFTPESIFGNIRVPHAREAEVIKLLNSIGPYLCMKEYTGTEHFHFALIRANVSRDTIAKKIRTVFPELKKQAVGGAKEYHVAHGKEPLFQLTYIFKEWHKTENPFLLSNIKEFKEYPLVGIAVLTRNRMMELFAEHCQTDYGTKKETFKKHTPGQFMEYLLKETTIHADHKNGVPDMDFDVGSTTPALTHWTNEEFRRELVAHAISYLKKIDIATCGPNKIWDLVNYANLHIDEESYLKHILFSTFAR
ncbi:MAG: hypothetical protein [Circular genetic element sp.]|nr:MAG: hypothetical protein [Circular genetic element sp.]